MKIALTNEKLKRIRVKLKKIKQHMLWLNDKIINQ
jgi:hypothetical protein